MQVTYSAQHLLYASDVGTNHYPHFIDREGRERLQAHAVSKWQPHNSGPKSHTPKLSVCHKAVLHLWAEGDTKVPLVGLWASHGHSVSFPFFINHIVAHVVS